MEVEEGVGRDKFSERRRRKKRGGRGGGMVVYSKDVYINIS